MEVSGSSCEDSFALTPKSLLIDSLLFFESKPFKLVGLQWVSDWNTPLRGKRETEKRRDFLSK